MIKSGIYKITNTANGKCYVGSASNLIARWRVHQHKLRKKNHHSPKLQNSWNKHGESHFIFSVIEYVEDRSILLEREQYWIDCLKAFGGGYNVCQLANSRLGVKTSAATKKKLSIAHTGKKLSKEHVENMSKATKGRKASANLSAHLSRLHSMQKGVPRTEEDKLKMSIGRTGMKMPPRSDEHKRKLSEATGRVWAQRRLHEASCEITRKIA